MGAGDESFWWYGLGLNIVLGLAMFIPFWRGRADALTAWNLLLVGSIIHIGIGSMEVYAIKMHWPELTWFTQSSHEEKWFFLGTTVFFLSLLFFHFKVKFPSRMLQNRLTKWPELSAGVVLFILAICMGGVAIVPFVRGVPFIGEVALNFSHSMLAIAVTFATVYWLKNRLSPFAFMLLVATFAVAAVEAMVIFAGRRVLLSVAIGPIAAMYWLSWRYWSRVKLIATFSAITFVLVILTAAYATFRWMQDERSASSMVAKVQAVSKEDVKERLSNLYHYFGQYTCHYSLFTMRLVDDGRLNVIPLETLQQILYYPIPRSIWPDKPRDECQWMSTTVMNMPYKTNWGVGMAGQGYHDGGLVVLILYAFLLSCLMRVFDVPLVRQPDNPFMIAALAAASAHIACIPRGSLANLTINTMECLVLILLLSFICRALFGTARTYAPMQYGWTPAQYPRHS